MLNSVLVPVNVNLVPDEPSSIKDPVALSSFFISIGLLTVVLLFITKLSAEVVIVVLLSPNTNLLEEISNESGVYLM